MANLPIIYALSDSLGETAEMVARATASQFSSGEFDIIRIPYITSVEQIAETVQEAANHDCVICHTLVSSNLREALLEQAQVHNIPTIDIMGPMIHAVQKVTGMTPRLKPGLIHKLDQEYFKRVEAVEFAVKYDDGKNPLGLLKADIVIIGVSRTSKTPLSMYLAHKKVKVANVPLVPEAPLPQELFQVPSHRIVGLIIDKFKLNEIRCERLKTMGLAPDASYANIGRIHEELDYARSIMRRLDCPVIDVSNKAIEETANRILEVVQKNKLAKHK
ncbi:pyruvate, water dikinase regulatory protein [Sporomusa sp.]|uniref:pyruvate, water dikinase regulatory protein n=1 Tax=Sporomusa sp. TaxID=2078658 RepID=UPI002BD4C3C7|nr:pyruvate, water dikinase regulatory protein [Sporomusa sp.]HWR05396.1 pyruvate, water dikinase regulatory protein [Sporomusa sp.]